MKASGAMRRDWDERAKKNAFHYIASWRDVWDCDSFLASGTEDYERFVTATLERCSVRGRGKIMVELGCGVGRMTPNFARHYDHVLAVDVSAEMLRQARQIHTAEKNILWLRVGGTDLACLSSESADFVFSYLVLQHLPTAEVSFGYVEEMMRVLRPGGAFLFQFNSSNKATMNLRGRIAWGVVDTLWSVKLISLSHAVASVLGLDFSIAGKSWRGAAIETNKIVEIVRSSGGEIRSLSGEDTPMTWCCGVKYSNS